MPPRKKSSAVSFLPIAGRWAFLLGLIIAIVFGLVQNAPSAADAQQWISYILIVLGLVAGYLHVAQEDEVRFILLAIGLAVFSSYFSNIQISTFDLGSYISGMLGWLGFFLGVAVIGVVVRYIVNWFLDFRIS